MTFLEPPRIIVGVGDVQDGFRPLMWALAEAQRRDAQLHLVRAWHDTYRPGPMTAYWRHRLEHDAEQLLVTALATATGGVAPPFGCRVAAREGIAADVLLGYANREDDLLVLGGSRRHLWPFRGWTMRRCVRNASCAVVVVPQAALLERRLIRELRRELKQWERV